MAHQEFHTFTRFPKEMQLLIWEEAAKLSPPRVVQLERRYLHEESDWGSESGEDLLALTSRTPFYTHPLLRACKDSRNVMLRNWPLSFGPVDGRHKGCVPFNFDIDTLYIDCFNDSHNFAILIKKEECRAIKTTAFSPHRKGGRYDDAWIDNFFKTLNEDFPNLEELCWIMDSRLLSYEEIYGVEGSYYDDMMPNLLALDGPMGFSSPDDSRPWESRTYNDRMLYEFKVVDWFEEKMNQKHPEWPVRITRHDPHRLFIGLQVDLWWNRLENEVNEDVLREKIQQHHELKDLERK